MISRPSLTDLGQDGYRIFNTNFGRDIFEGTSGNIPNGGSVCRLDLLSDPGPIKPSSDQNFNGFFYMSIGIYKHPRIIHINQNNQKAMQ